MSTSVKNTESASAVNRAKPPRHMTKQTNTLTLKLTASVNQKTHVAYPMNLDNGIA